MSNIIIIGNYSLSEDFRTAGAKRVLNQIKFLKEYNEILCITFSPHKSRYDFNINLKSNAHKNLIDLFRIPFYWLFIFWQLFERRREKNILILESVVDIHTSAPVLFAKLLDYNIIHDVVEDFSKAEDFTTKQKLSFFISDWFGKRITQYCSGLIVISEKLLMKYQNANIPIIKLYNSIDDQEQVNLKCIPPRFVLFYSGSFGRKDGVINLIDAFELLLKKRKDIHLKLVGKGYGAYYNECLKKIGGHEYITYLGFLPESEMISQLVNSHILCVTRSNSEYANSGFPFKLAEYMSFGIPVLTTTVSDIPIILENKETAFFAKPECARSIAKAIELIINNYFDSVQVGKNGRVFCQNNFSINSIGIQLQHFLGNL